MQISVTKKTLLLTLLLSTGSGWAEWQEIGRSVNAVIYIDPETIRKNGNLRRVWTLVDSTGKSKDGSMSTRMREEYDCKDERKRVLSISTHSEAMASGNQLLSHTYAEPTQWQDIPPNTGTVEILKLVCAK
jgi:hypothetical protein